ncbi:MAG TPA: GNAT family N-acetyltransferase [Candidatus Cybelea sp.]
MRTQIRRALPEDAFGIARTHVTAWDRAFRGIVPADIIAARTVEVRIEQWTGMLQRPERMTLVACGDDGAIHGFASALPIAEPNFQSYLEALYVAPDVWERGLGRELLSAIAAELLDRGVANMALRTLRMGAARSFYEHLGARLVPEGVDRDADRFDDVVYGFDDLRLLAKRGLGQGTEPPLR